MSKTTYYTFTSVDELNKQFGTTPVKRRVWRLPAQLVAAWKAGLPTGKPVTMEDITKWSDTVIGAVKDDNGVTLQHSEWSDKYVQSPDKIINYYLTSGRDACMTDAHVKIENK